MLFSSKQEKKIGRNVNKDILLCATTNPGVEERASNALIGNSISISKRWRTIPLFERNAYQGARRICEISINRNEYSRARRIIENLPSSCQDRLFVHVR